MGRAVCENWLRSEACREWAAWAACLEWLACQLRSEAQLLLKSVDTFQTSWPGGMGGFPFDFGGPDLGVLSVLDVEAWAAWVAWAWERVQAKAGRGLELMD